MIQALTGMPGSGKSFALTKIAYNEIKKGRNVYANFYIKGAKKITFEDICTYSFPQDSVVIVDEAGRWFNSRNWKSLPSDVFDLFTMHRHMKMDLYVGVQNFNRIDLALREVIELVWWAWNLPFLPYFIHYGYYDLEKVGAMKEHDKLKLIWKSRKIRNLYDTHTMKSAWDDKEVMPDIEWEPGYKNPTLFSSVKTPFLKASRFLKGKLKKN